MSIQRGGTDSGAARNFRGVQLVKAALIEQLTGSAKNQ
jgi:hypothetical protein